MTELLTKLFIKNHQNTDDISVRENYGTFAGIVGIVVNLLLSVIKIAVGSISGSISVTADGFNNLSDMGSSVITMIGFKLSSKPADSDHPFGHGRMEYVSGFIVAMLILLVGFELLSDSFLSLIHGEEAPQYTVVSFVVLIVSILIKLWLHIFNKKLGRKIDSETLLATAQDSINDVLASFAILVSVAVQYFFKLPFNLDAVMGIGVGLFILYAGYNTAKDTLDEILGKPPTKELTKQLEKDILEYGFLGIHDLLVHNYGKGRCFSSVHVEVPQDTDIVLCHEKIDLCEKAIGQKYGMILVIHMDPIDTSPVVTETRNAMTELVKTIDERITLHDFRMTPKSFGITNLIFDIVLPPRFHMSDEKITEEIQRKAKEIDKTFITVVTIDRDYT